MSPVIPDAIQLK